MGLFSQTDSIYNFTLPEIKISQIEKGKIVTYEFDNKYNSFAVTDSFLIANPNKYDYKVNIKNIKKVTFIKGSPVLPAAVTGFGIGFIFGYLLQGLGGHGSVADAERLLGGLMTGAVLGFVTGGIFLLISHDDEYDIREYDLKTRKKFLIKTFKENKFK
jgi:hypothetical protein